MVIESRTECESEYAAIKSISTKLGITSPKSLRKWLRGARSTMVFGRARQPRNSRRELKATWAVTSGSARTMDLRFACAACPEASPRRP